MKKIFSLLCLVLAGGLVLGLASCAKPPTEEMEEAIAVVAAAENNADAVKYAGSSLVRARALVTDMEEAANSKRYEEARSLASEAIAAANKAVTDGKAGAERAKNEAANLIASVDAAADETEGAINSAKMVKGINLDFWALEQDLQSARTTADGARVSFTSGDYQVALEKGRNARAALSDIATRIAQATVSVSRKK